MGNRRVQGPEYLSLNNTRRHLSRRLCCPFIWATIAKASIQTKRRKSLRANNFATRDFGPHLKKCFRDRLHFFVRLLVELHSGWSVSCSCQGVPATLEHTGISCAWCSNERFIGGKRIFWNNNKKLSELTIQPRSSGLLQGEMEFWFELFSCDLSLGLCKECWLLLSRDALLKACILSWQFVLRPSEFDPVSVFRHHSFFSHWQFYFHPWRMQLFSLFQQAKKPHMSFQHGCCLQQGLMSVKICCHLLKEFVCRQQKGGPTM